MPGVFVCSSACLTVCLSVCVGVADQGDGFKYAMKGLDGGRINIGTCSVGAVRAMQCRHL